MAGRKLKVQGKVQASTILEVVIAMVMIVVVFGIALMIFSNISRLSLSVKKLNAEAILQDRLLKIEQYDNNTDEIARVGELHIEQKVTHYNDDNHLSQVQLTAYDDNNNIVAELQKVIINP
ncbi:MAG TPA: hypothetical protein VJ844_09265 [Mucilaginibacter sp.]|nr:hypothetical protein [Mucilaginibacter sp.]